MSLVLGAVRDGDEVRESVKEILARDEFADAAADEVFADPLYYVMLGVNEVFSYFVGAAGDGFWLVGWAMAVAFVVLVGALCFRLVRNSSRNDAVNETGVVPAQQARQDLVAEAEQLEAAGEWRRAIRARHAALVATLAEYGVLRRRPGTTAREYAAQLATSAPHAKSTFDEATWLFEWVWYGAMAPGPDEAARFKSLYDDVCRIVRK